MRRLHLRLFQVLTTSTPVLTGFARAGWVPSTGAPTPGPSEAPSDQTVAEAQAATLFGQNKQVSARIAQGYKLSDGPIFIVNNVAYVVYLNEGTSAQAPAMFVEAGIAQAVAATQRELST